MRKLLQKSASFIPPNQGGFERTLQLWLRNKSTIAYSIRCGMKKIGSYREPDYESWFNHALKETREILEELYSRYNIQPGDILEVLAFNETRDCLYSSQVEAKARSVKLRQKDSRVLNQAAEILIDWRYFLALEGKRPWPPAPTLRDMTVEELRDVAIILCEIGPSQAHRPKIVKLKECANALAGLFSDAAGHSLYGYVGRILRAAYPESWIPEGDIREAAKKLVKSWDRKISAKKTIRTRRNGRSKRLLTKRGWEIERSRQRWKQRRDRIRS